LAKELPAGVAHEIDINQFQSIVEVFDRSVHKFRDRPAMANMDKILSYGRAANADRAVCVVSAKHPQAEKGDRVAVMMPNLLQYPVAVFGTCALAAPWSTSTRCTPRASWNTS
jgi:long-chain acyl-CoA synthetase